MSFARIGAISGPIIGGWIAATGVSFEFNFIFFAVVGVIAAGAVALIPPRITEAQPRVARTDEELVAD
ncbi:hypothetical protein [Glutamicibacter protophormiae]|uniref:hypothetical protein n=1 Tax=Glutamicibacter protophormiae TaxID=37930 RepID=UPI003BAEBEF2